MKMPERRLWIGAAFIAAFAFIFTQAPAPAASNAARVTYLKGVAYKSRKKAGRGVRLRRGYTVQAGYYVKTGKRSRLELRMPDGSKIRLASKSVLYLSRARFRRARDYQVRLYAGKVYTKARHSRSKKDRFIVRSGGAVAGIRGTAFDTILMPDGSTRVKCFQGKVFVANYTDYVQRILQGGEREINPNHLYEPKEVPGPKEVTEEEFMQIISSMMSVTVSADGTVQTPQQMSKDDVDEWEDWNRKRDAQK